MRDKRELISLLCVTPMHVALRGAAAGMAATAVLSALSRVLPGMSHQLQEKQFHEDQPGAKPTLPQDRYDPDLVREWQMRSWSPAAKHPHPDQNKGQEASELPGATPASALVQPVSPGPEGLAEQFAFKLASGLFGRDISRYTRPAGLAVHFTYGSAWGLLFGLLQASRRRRPVACGALYGLLVYLVGPACLVPAMKIMRRPAEEPPVRTIMLLAGHILYGVSLATVFDRLEQEAES